MPAKTRPPNPLVTVLLTEINNNYKDARARRVQAVLSAKAAGITNKQIGDAYGISEVAVRGLAKRAQHGVSNGR